MRHLYFVFRLSLSLIFHRRQCYIYEPMYFIHSLIYDDHNIIDSEALEQGVQH